ncbi:MAG: 7-cyano-7-deazaguanine synthase QueC [Legionellales bacterium]
MKKAIILVSGGLDSATCLALARSQGYACYALSFSYGQRHASELLAAKRVAASLGAVDHKIVTLDAGLFGGSALTDNSIEVPEYRESDAIPVTYVPARNTIFLSMALGLAESIGARAIFIGASSVDYSHYPDCRPEFIKAFQDLANIGTKAGLEGTPFSINAPLQHLSKVQTIQLGAQLGVDYGLTVSCYKLNEAGQACGSCDSCTFRKKGFEGAGIPDPTPYI